MWELILGFWSNVWLEKSAFSFQFCKIRNDIGLQLNLFARMLIVDTRLENLETAVTFCRPRDDGGPYTFNLAE